jgi:dynein heavy chain
LGRRERLKTSVVKVKFRLHSLSPYVTSLAPQDPSFNYESLKGISTAGAGLLKWVLAMVNYNNVAKTVEPKRKKVAEAEKNLRLATKDLAITKQQVEELSAMLETLRKQFEEKTSEQQVWSRETKRAKHHISC